MRRRPILAFVLVSSVVACSKSNEAANSAYGPVRISIGCNDDGTIGSFYITSWATRLPDKHAAFRFFNDGGVDMVIAAQNPKDPRYPFNGQSLQARSKGYVDGKPIIGTPADTYKYSITVTCPVTGGSPKTNIIDPDMIIPWRIDEL